MAENKESSTGSAPAGAAGGPTAEQLKKMATQELFLLEAADEGSVKRNLIFFSIALLFHALLFAITYPDFSAALQKTNKERKVVKVRKYVPPPPPDMPKKKIERKLTKKVPLPDPTPDEPEPIIEPEPPPEPPPMDPDMDIVIGVPEPPPLSGPLMAGLNGVTNPEVIEETKVLPEYPEPARRARIEGKVYLQAVVRRDGTIGELTVLKEPATNLGFADAALAAVRQWRYKPATQGGRPVDVYITVYVTFSLD